MRSFALPRSSWVRRCRAANLPGDRGIYRATARTTGRPRRRRAARPNAPPDTFAFILNSVVLAFAALAVPMSFILPAIVSTNGRKAAIKQVLSPSTTGAKGKGAKFQTSDEPQSILLPFFHPQLIVGAATLEGATFFAAAVYILIGGLIAPATAIVLLVVLAARFPTESRAQQWLDQQREKLRDDQFAASASP